MKKKLKKLEKRVELLESIINATQDKVVIIKEDKVIETKPTFKPVFMKCTQEQFDKMRPKLEILGCAFTDSLIAKPSHVLTNDNQDRLISFVIESSDLNKQRTEVQTEAEFLEACGYVEHKEAKREPKVGDVVKAWDNTGNFIYGVYEEHKKDESAYVVSNIWFDNIELVTEISINDFKREEN